MRLIFDHNLSPKLVSQLADVYPDSLHVYHLKLHEASDQEVWAYAQKHYCTIVTRDADFSEMSMLLGFPPKVIWIRIGNCTTETIASLLRTNVEAVHGLAEEDDRGILTLF